MLVLLACAIRPGTGKSICKCRQSPQSLSSDFLSAFLVCFCLLSVSWQGEGKAKGGVPNESPFKAVSPDLEQGLVQRRASRLSVEGNTFRDNALHQSQAWIPPGSEKGSLRQCEHTEHVLVTGRELALCEQAEPAPVTAIHFPQMANPSQCSPPPASLWPGALPKNTRHSAQPE